MILPPLKNFQENPDLILSYDIEQEIFGVINYSLLYRILEYDDILIEIME